MKELSIAEKMRAYDGNYKVYTELINRFEGVKSAIKKQNYGIAMDILCKPYPEHQITTSTEFKESEDERIRKWIINEIKINHHNLDDDNVDFVDKAIAWLERQGESKNIDSNDLETLEIWEDAIKENKEKWQLSDWFVEATLLLIQKVKRIENNENINIKGSRVMLNACVNALRNVGHLHLSNWLEKQGNKDKLIKELGEYKVKYTQEVLEKHINSMGNKDDERLRKTTIAFLKDFADKGYENAVECIDWLEKQGIIDINPSEFDLRLNKLLKQFETLPKEELANSLSFYLNVVQNDGTYKQKLSGKVKPKFKVGDWITDGEKVWKIGYIEDDTYIEHCDSISAGGFIESIDKHYHLWSIKDAKDGDVLVDVYGNIGIFKERYGINWHTYCYLGNKGRFISEGGSHGSICYPATKEQRDLLFTKMKEASYKWDVEKKELKKIENVEIPLGAKDSELQEAIYYIPKGFHAEIKGDSVFIKKGEKPIAWSEEDETKLRQVEYACMKFYGGDCSHIDWLRKATRPQNQWKPSDEQMASITCAMRKMKESACYDSELVSLFNDLNKLMEK